MRNKKTYEMTPDQFHKYIMENSRKHCEQTENTTVAHGNHAKAIEEIIAHGKELYKKRTESNVQKGK